jgi:hypothetical protein
MQEHGHQHAHPPHRTGHSWLDISLAVSAFFVSLSSLRLAMHNARTMERLVAANSYRWARLDAARKDLKIGVRVCYCSVFDQCYLHDNAYREPRRIGACPAPVVPYAGG